jgi:hypothetical protein
MNLRELELSAVDTPPADDRSTASKLAREGQSGRTAWCVLVPPLPRFPVALYRVERPASGNGKSGP